MTAKFYGVRKHRAEYDKLARRFQVNYADIIGNDDYFFSDEDYEFDSFTVFDKKVKNDSDNKLLNEKWDAAKLALSEELLIIKEIVDTLSELGFDSGVAYNELLTSYYNIYFDDDHIKKYEKSEKLRVRVALDRVQYDIARHNTGGYRRFVELYRLACRAEADYRYEKEFKTQVVKKYNSLSEWQKYRILGHNYAEHYAKMCVELNITKELEMSERLITDIGKQAIDPLTGAKILVPAWSRTENEEKLQKT